MLIALLIGMTPIRARAGVRRLATSIAQYTVPQINQSGQVVWQGGPGTNGEIFLWDGTTARPITGGNPRSVYPQINNAGQVLWSDSDGQHGQIYLWDGTQVRPLADGTRNNLSPSFNDRGQVVWVSQAGTDQTAEIDLWNGSQVRQLTSNSQNDRNPRINNRGQVVWEGGAPNAHQIYFWDGWQVRQLTGSGDNSFPQINQLGHVVWAGFAPTDNPRISTTQIYLWDGASIRQLSSGIELKNAARLNDHDQVVWWRQGRDSWQIEYWDGSVVQPLPYRSPSNNGIALWASLNNAGQVAWQSWDGTDWEIELWSEGSVRQFTTNRRDDALPSLNDAGQMVWASNEANGEAVYLYTPRGVSTLNLEPDTIAAGGTASATVTLAQPAPPGGAVVTVTSDPPDAASVPAQVTVPAGSRTAAFTVITHAVPDTTDVLLTAALGGEANTATLTVLPVALQAVTLEPATVSGGASPTGTVRLAGPAPPSGATVALASSDRLLTAVPASVTVPPGATSATFSVTTLPVTAGTPVQISAVYGATQTATLVIVPYALASLAVNPTAVAGGQPASGTVGLNHPAPTGGLVVLLNSSNPLAAVVPASVTIPAGATDATFPVASKSVAAAVPVLLTASFGGVTRAATLVVAPALPVLSADQIQVINLPTNDLVYDPFSGRIWASVPGSAGPAGNSVVPIDPLTGALGTPIFVGSEPDKLAVSDDGQYLYVGLDGASAVRRVELAARAAGLQFPLVSDPGAGQYQVGEIAVVPGSPQAVVVRRQSRTGPTDEEALVVYDNGSPRPKTIPAESARYSIAFGASPNRLYAYDAGIYHDGFARLALDASGLTPAGGAVDLIRGEGVAIQFAGGRLYATSGVVVDPEALALLGTFPDIPAPSPMAVDASRGQAYFLTGDGAAGVLRAFDTASFLPVAALPITGAAGTAGPLIRWGQERADGGGLAFRTSAGQLFLIRTASMTAAAPAVSFTPGAVTGGLGVTGHVTLAAPAPEGGVLVTLASDQPSVTVPASVTVPGGATSAPFPVATTPVATDQTAVITASAGGVTGSGRLQVLAPTFLSMTFAKTSVAAGQVATGAVALSGPAAVDVPVTLQSSLPEIATVPASVIIRAGSTSASFPLTAGTVSTDTTVQITAAALGVTYTTQLQVTAPRIAAFTLDRSRVVGGEIVTGTVTLEAPAPAGGIEITLSPPTLDLPAGPVRVPAGAISVTFPIRTPLVKEPSEFDIAAWYGSSVQSAPLQLLPLTLDRVTVEPASIRGGDTARGTVFLSGPAPDEGLVITLSSDRQAVATPPAAVVIPAGASSASFVATSTPVAAPVTVTLAASALGTTQLAALQVMPAGIHSFSLNVNRVVRGSPARGTITMNAPAPAGGLKVKLKNDHPEAARVPEEVDLPAGATSATFMVATYRVRRPVTVRLVATAGGDSRSTALSVLPSSHGRR